MPFFIADLAEFKQVGISENALARLENKRRNDPAFDATLRKNISRVAKKRKRGFDQGLVGAIQDATAPTSSGVTKDVARTYISKQPGGIRELKKPAEKIDLSNLRNMQKNTARVKQAAASSIKKPKARALSKLGSAIGRNPIKTAIYGSLGLSALGTAGQIHAAYQKAKQPTVNVIVTRPGQEKDIKKQVDRYEAIQKNKRKKQK